MRWHVRAAATATAALMSCCVLASAAHATGQVSDDVGAIPSPGSSLSPGGWYLLNADPGEAFTQSVRITNPNHHAVEVHIDAADGRTSDQTGSDLGKPGDAATAAGRWIVVTNNVITLQPAEVRDVSFSVHVPPHLAPGQYLAGLRIYVPLTSHSTAPAAPKNGVSLTMDTQFENSIGIEVDVPGPRAPKLVITGVTPTATPKGIALQLHIENTGNAFAHGQGVVRVADTNTDATFAINTFVSGTAIVYPFLWTQAIAPGSHHVEVDLTYEGGRRTTWTGTVNAEGLAAALRNIYVPPKHGAGFPWLVVLAIVLFLLLVGGAIALRRRSRDASYVKYRPI
jgi:hypothetical protein